MHDEVKNYWIKLLDTLLEFAQGFISFEEYHNRVLSIYNEISEEQRGFDTTTKFTYIFLDGALVSALAEVTPDECEENEDLRDVARWFFREYFDVFICGKKPAILEAVFGDKHFPVFPPGRSIPEYVRLFMAFAKDFVKNPQVLSPQTIRFLHSIYLQLKPETILEVLCIEALHSLLPYLSRVNQDALPAFETKNMEVDIKSFNQFKEWIEKLEGKRTFKVKLIYYKNIIIVRIA